MISNYFFIAYHYEVILRVFDENPLYQFRPDDNRITLSFSLWPIRKFRHCNQVRILTQIKKLNRTQKLWGIFLDRKRKFMFVDFKGKPLFGRCEGYLGGKSFIFDIFFMSTNY